MTAARVAAFVALFVAASFAGCTRAEPVNPNLLAPKLIVDADLNGRLIVFMHSAFGERSYDRLELTADNVSRASNRDAYSLEHRLDAAEAFLETRVRAGESRFVFEGHVRYDPVEERLRVTGRDADGEWLAPRTFGVPFERIMDRDGGKTA